MSMAAALSADFDADVRGRGIDYYRKGAVKRLRVGKSDVSAEVLGSGFYDVDLELDHNGRTVYASCSCPYARDSGPCKHLWAVILAAEARGFARGRTKLELVLEDFGDEDEDEYAEEVEDDYAEEDEETYAPRVRRTAARSRSAAAKPRTNWKDKLAALRQSIAGSAPAVLPFSAAKRKRLLFVVDVPTSAAAQELALEIQVQDLKLNGEWGKPKSASIRDQDMDALNDPLAEQIVDLFRGASSNQTYSYGYSYSSFGYGVPRYQVSGPLLDACLPLLVKTERLFLRREKQAELEPVIPDLDTVWRLEAAIKRDASGRKLILDGQLRHDGAAISLDQPLLIVPGLVFCETCMNRLENSDAVRWLRAFRTMERLEIPASNAEKFLQELLEIPNLPPIELPEELRYSEVQAVPKPQVVVKKIPYDYRNQGLHVDLSFDYEGHVVPADPRTRGIYEAEGRRFLLRNVEAETAAANELTRLGARVEWVSGRGQAPVIPPSRLANLVRQLTAAGWLVKAEGKLYRQASGFNLEVKSGQDWFDLRASASFEGTSVSLPRLLEALRRGDSTIVLDDGSLGMLPEEWLKKYGLFAQMGAVQGDVVRYSRAQVGVLDALLASRPEVEFDKAFGKARQELRKFDGVAPVDPPASFKGELRPYQREGLGWLRFLRKFGFGGCLADDMGLGKTVQVLALLADKKVGPTLVVVPKSLVFNWKQEAARFAPHLKVLDHTGLTRDRSGASFKGHDIVITTYGTLRNDAAVLSEFRFDTCILDESQAAKNSETETAKAVRLIQADHRLSLSGTPIENHLGELWTLFDFLNPGMLGHSGLFGSTPGSARNADPETRQLLARALKPYILRRTKDQVAKDLPEKTEQTIYCDLEPEQRALYDELRDHYRQSLLTRVDQVGLNRSKIQVLEALLRLRQAACHPGLLDKGRCAQPSAKLDVLLPQLEELLEEGHKALVFSQFTTLLGIVRMKLDAMGLKYEYLDGRTSLKERANRVERFQTNPESKLFLVSLKAGGVGLNLTAAEYVFLLDPWWNPAVEAQAIDRSHRIGQTKPVFAYRLIAKNTVEEKVLALQESKRDLANAILGGDGRLLSELKREDLELLLS